MALNEHQQNALSKAAAYINSLGNNLTGAKLYAWWQAAGLSDAKLMDLVAVVRAERKQAIQADFRAARKAAEDAGYSAQEWAAITAAEESNDDDQ